jgi:hypothetical protein
MIGVTVDIELPQIAYGPFRVGVGSVECVLRGPEKVTGSLAGEMQISSRIKVPVHKLSNGETVIITGRRIGLRPSGVDGVLLEDGSNRLRWQAHAQIDELTESDNEGMG